MKDFIKQNRIRFTSEPVVRKLYSEFRSIANKRIQRIDKAGLPGERSLFPTIQQIEESDKFDVFSALSDVQKFLRSNRNTVTGAKKFYRDMRKTMTEMGYGSLVQTNEDIYQMVKYMEYLREQYGDNLFDSGDALDVLEQGQRLNIPMDKLKQNYELFATNLDKMEKLRKSPGGGEFSQSRIEKLINKWS